jgi:hypothetical protein
VSSVTSRTEGGAEGARSQPATTTTPRKDKTVRVPLLRRAEEVWGSLCDLWNILGESSM